MSDQHRARTGLDIAVKHGFKFNGYHDGSTDYTDSDGFIDAPEDLAGSVAEFFDSKVESMQAEIEKLKADNKQWEEMHKSSLYGNIGEIKAQGIEEANNSIDIKPNLSESEYWGYKMAKMDFENYANSLRDKGSD